MAKIIIHPKNFYLDQSGKIEKRKGVLKMERDSEHEMLMPEGWKRLKDKDRITRDMVSLSRGECGSIADLMKEMAEALIKVQAIAEMTMPNGTVAPTPLYDDVTPVLNKFKEWK